MADRKNIYFASDFHLGVPNEESSREREKQIVRWLDIIRHDAAEIFLVGDVFDFWHEYKHVVPRGYVRLLGKLAELTDDGIKIYFFAGNHDLWLKGYLEKELNLEIHHKPFQFERNGKTFYVAHGDGLGPGDRKFKFMKSFFTNPVLQWMFSRVHPNFAVGLARFLSRKSRMAKGRKDEEFLGEKEWLIVHSRELLSKQKIDYFLYGHRHFPVEYPLGNDAVYFNLGDWVYNQSYVKFDGEKTTLAFFKD
ncbi:MAG: UDP-2,3-diacylglucosamine diphosphatase [Bacteroidota bacterium]